MLVSHGTKGEIKLTVFATRVNHAQKVKIGITYGPVSTYIEEDAGHLRSFHTQLGQILDNIDQEKETSNG